MEWIVGTSSWPWLQAAALSTPKGDILIFREEEEEEDEGERRKETEVGGRGEDSTEDMISGIRRGSAADIGREGGGRRGRLKPMIEILDAR